jgi:hypothetical protein
VTPPKQTKQAKGTVGEDAAGKKTKGKNRDEVNRNIRQKRPRVKIETRLIDEMFTSVMGECVIYKV